MRSLTNEVCIELTTTPLDVGMTTNGPGGPGIGPTDQPAAVAVVITAVLTKTALSSRARSRSPVRSPVGRLQGGSPRLWLTKNRSP
jgi:hypothetical protein